MLLSMQQLASSAPQPQAHGFAELLAGLAVPEKKPPQRDLDGLEDDVAMFSYEQALRSASHPLRQPVAEENPPAPSLATNRRSPAGSAGSQPRPRRAASVTVRLSALEAAQLRLRAAEAGLNVSAYLRSCAFEIESLRAQVKSAVAELRSAKTLPEASGNELQPAKKMSWLLIRLQSCFPLFRRRTHPQLGGVTPPPAPGISDIRSPGY